MKAAVIHEFGDYDVLKLEDVPTPRPKPGHILIKILAAGVNRFEHYLREGSVAPELPFPHILGTDAGGEVLIARWGVPSISEVKKWLWLLAVEDDGVLTRRQTAEPERLPAP